MSDCLTAILACPLIPTTTSTQGLVRPSKLETRAMELTSRRSLADRSSSILKYCILGDAGVGKTSLLFRLTQPGEPLRAPEPTIGVDFGSKVLEVGGGRRVKVQCESGSGVQQVYEY